MVKNAYIHIPFCMSKCNYCSFVSSENLNYIDDYFKALKSEINYFYNRERLNTLYFGGGTPSIFPVEYIKEIINIFEFENNPEITIEVNPNDVTASYLQMLLQAGVNRLSMGVQTFDDEILNVIGRRHSSDEVFKAIKLAKNLGFENISIDLIYGLPNQTLDKFKVDLEKAVDLDIQHISFYGLKIEEGCKFFVNPPKSIPDLDVQADMYEFLCEYLLKQKFEHYEISNFSKKGFNSRHNLNYWDNNSYYGFGVASHGYDGYSRYENKVVLKDYINNPLEHLSSHKLSLEEKLEEEIFLGFRKASGINIQKIKDVYNFDFENQYVEVLKKYQDFFLKTNQGYAFNMKGFLLSNIILSEFIQ